MKHRGLYLAALLFLTRLPLNVVGQANKSNFFIWQAIVEQDMKSVLSRPEDKTYVAGKSFKVYSQDFQTVFSSDSRLTRYDECLVVDFGDGCPDMLSFQTVEQLNGGKLQELVAAVSVERSIALIQRGGRCDSWMSKINATMTFATQHHMNLRAFLFYDNRTFAGAQQLTMRNTTDNNYPIWTKPMPASRNASHMVDNDVRPMTTTTLTVPVYFGPSAFGISVKEAIVDAAAFQSASAIRRFVQLQPYFEETTFLIDQTNHSSKAEHYDGSSLGDSNFSTFGNQREYLAYVIAAVVIIVFAILCSRFFRKSQQEARNNALEAAERGLLIAGRQPQAKTDHMSLEKLDAMCPVQELSGSKVRNTACAICLEELQPQDQVRILPCAHGFCAGCIDVWLTKKSTLCPVCKYDCDPQENGSKVSFSSIPGEEGLSSSVVQQQQQQEASNVAEGSSTIAPSSPITRPLPVHLQNGPTSSMNTHPAAAGRFSSSSS